MHKGSALLASLLVFGILVAGCGGSANSGGAGKGAVNYASNGTFTMVLNEDRGAFDPYFSRLSGLEKFAYDSLVNMQPNGEFVSGLAQEWTADAHSASFTLRPDVTCSDGSPLTAGQVAAALNFIGDPKNLSLQYGINTPTVPYEATADDAAKKVTVTVEKPFGFLLNTIGLAPIVCAKGLANRKLLKTGSDGTGPYVVTNVVPGQSYTFTVRKDYRWGPHGATTKEPGTPAKIVFRIIPNEATAANLLLSGEANMALITGDDRARLSARGLKTFDSAGGGMGLRFNQRDDKRPTADQRVRRALVQALDRDQLVKVTSGGAGRPATGLSLVEPRACPGDLVSGRLPKYDVAAAESTLDQAGWIKGGDGVRTKNGRQLAIQLIYINANSNYEKPTTELIAQKWKAIGVDVKVRSVPFVSLTNVLYETGDWDVYTGLGTAYLPSAWVPFVSGPYPPKGKNLAGQNKDYEALVAKAQPLTPPAACPYWNQAEQALYRDLNIVPIADRRATYYLSHATAQPSGYEQPVPTSVRLLK